MKATLPNGVILEGTVDEVWDLMRKEYEPVSQEPQTKKKKKQEPILPPLDGPEDDDDDEDEDE